MLLTSSDLSRQLLFAYNSFLGKPLHLQADSPGRLFVGAKTDKLTRPHVLSFQCYFGWVFGPQSRS